MSIPCVFNESDCTYRPKTMAKYPTPLKHLSRGVIILIYIYLEGKYAAQPA
jgi:hypothetical protein